jgi:hypothetical protein
MIHELHPPEVMRSPFGGLWTAVRAGFDEAGAFELWIGKHFPTYAQAEQAAHDWEVRMPSTHPLEELPDAVLPETKQPRKEEKP